MSNIIQHKRNATAGAIPTAGNLSYGELAINYADGKLYTKSNNDIVINLPVTSISGTAISPASGIFSGTVSAVSFSGAGTSLTGTASSLTAGSVTNGVYTTGNQPIGGVKTFSSQIINTSAGSSAVNGGQIYLNGITNNRIDFNSNGLGTPASPFTPTTVGSKIILHPFTFGSASSFGFGIAGGGTGGSAPAEVLWSQVGKTSNSFDWYAQTTKVATLTGSGVLTIQGGTSQINVDNLRLDGSTVSRTNTGHVTISPSLYSDNGYFGNIYAGGGEAGSSYGALYVYDDVDNVTFEASSFGVYSNLPVEINGYISFLPRGSGQVSLDTNGELQFERVSNTQLKILMRGTDGVTRSTTLTLS